MLLEQGAAGGGGRGTSNRQSKRARAHYQYALSVCIISILILDVPTLCPVPDRADNNVLVLHAVQDNVRSASDD